MDKAGGNIETKGEQFVTRFIFNMVVILSHRRRICAQTTDVVQGVWHRLTWLKLCPTFACMKSTSLTFRLDEDLNRLLSQASRQSGKSRSTFPGEALVRYLRLIQFEALRKKAMPFAKVRGYLWDEDLIRDIS